MVKAGKALGRIARERGFRTLITGKWPVSDVVCTGVPKDEREVKRLRRQYPEQWWIYPNKALSTKNRCYTRYVFGFGAWQFGVNGVVPWTFQMSQGCNGNPFSVLDGEEVMVAYPGKDELLCTPTWETIRDGINDYKYIYLLERLIAAERKKGNEAAFQIEQELDGVKKKLGKMPGIDENAYGDWSPEAFEQKRKQIVDWILQLSSLEL